MKPFSSIAVAVFALVALLHLLRVLSGWDVVINGVAIPPWASMIFFLIAATLAVMVSREAKR